MPTLEEATQSRDLGGYSPANRPTGAIPAFYTGREYPENPNQFLRCPIPPVAATSDSLRQYYRGGVVPQARIMTPTTLASASGSSSTTNVTTNTTNNTTVATTIGTMQSASVTTPVLNPGETYQTTLSTSTGFIPLTLATSDQARVELYNTATAQTIDMSRSSLVSPGPATQQGILLDVTLDTSPLLWQVTPSLPAANGDSPQLAQCYITVTNVSSSSVAITASLQYLILEV